MSDLYPILLEQLFMGHVNTLRSLLKSLNEEERKELYHSFKELLPVLRQACKIDWGKEKKNLQLDKVYQWIKANRQHFIQEQWPKLESKHTLYTSKWSTEFFIRLQCLQVGLASVKHVTEGLKRGFDCPDVDCDKKGPTHFVTHVGGVLLDRPESWVKEVILKFCENINKWVYFRSGFTDFMIEVKQKYPEWQAELYPYMGKAMLTDGFYDPTAKPAYLDADMILAGLEHDGTGVDWSSPYRMPIRNAEVIKKVLYMLETRALNREALLKLTFKKLMMPLSPPEAKGWLDFYQQLKVTDQELEKYLEYWVDMLNSPIAGAARLACQIVTLLWQKKKLSSKTLLPVLIYLLQHPVQGVTQAAFALLKKMEPECRDEIVQASIDALSNPHKKLRQDILKWLPKTQPACWSSSLKDALKVVAEGLEAREKTLLPDLGLSEEVPRVVQTKPLWKLPVKSEPLSPIQNQWYTFLESYQKTGQISSLNPLSPVISPSSSLEVIQTAEELAHLLAGFASRSFSFLEFELAMDGVLRFQSAGQETRIQKILNPVQTCLEKAQQVKEEPWGWNFNDILLVSLVFAWQHRGQAITFEPNSLGQQFRDFVDQSLLARLEGVKNCLKANLAIPLLALPTSQEGWIASEMFAERFQMNSVKHLALDELTAALYRLTPQGRDSTWNQLKECVSDLKQPVDQALAIALGPESTIQNAVECFMTYFRKISAKKLSFIKMRKAGGMVLENLHVERTFSLEANQRLRLFTAALRCRYGIVDLRTACPVLKTFPVQQLLSSLWGTEFRRNYARAEQKKDLTAIESLFFNPPPINQDFRQNTVVSTFGSLIHMVDVKLAHFPQLFPYLLYIRCPGYGDPYDEHAVIWPYVQRFPAAAQKFFEAGIAASGGNHVLKNDLALGLIAVGKLSHVDVLPYLSVIAGRLGSKFPNHRERGVELFLQWLQDGRITPEDMVGVLTPLLQTTDQGFKYLDESLQSFCAAGRAFQEIVLLALEKTVASGLTELKPRNQSMLLDRLGLILETLGRAIENTDTRNHLEDLVQSKKKSVLHDKARWIITLHSDVEQLPLAVSIVTSLL